MSVNKNLNTKSTFYRKIESNPNICTNCYRRISFVAKPDEERMHHSVTARREYEDHVEFDYFDDKHETGRPSVKRSFCKCGFVDAGKIRPLDKKELMKVAVRVRDRLDEEEIEFDEDEFFGSVKREKSNPDNQFNEEAILENAVNESLITNDE